MKDLMISFVKIQNIFNRDHFILVARNCNPHFDLTISGSQVRDFIPFDLIKADGGEDQDANKNKTDPEVQIYVPEIPKVHFSLLL